jgi:transposase
MQLIVPQLRWTVKERFRKQLRQCHDAALRVRYLVILNLDNGRGARQTAKGLGIHNTTVYRIAKRFRQHGEWGLYDGREDNGLTKLDERYLDTLYAMVRSSANEHGWRRPTWTREMLVETMTRKTGIRIHVATMSRALALIQARRGRPRPAVGCPWSKAAKTRRVNALRRLLQTLPRGEVAVYEDEVDVHLNPKIGLDWMVRGQQKEVMTPGKNQKRYLAGALDAATGAVFWVEGEQKASALFIALLDKLARFFSRTKVIHVILDNYRIHTSKITDAALRGYGGKIRLHFLPPYCPRHNKLERVWEDLHANVTRNHNCADMASLMHNVRGYLYDRNRALAEIALGQAA